MSEDKYHDLVEPKEVTEDPEESSERASTTDDADSEVAEESKGNDDAQVRKQKQIAHWQSEIDAGNATIEDLPHEWLKKEVKPKTDLDALLEEKLNEKLAAKEAEQRFTEAKAQLKGLGLDAETLQEVIDEAKDLEADGVPAYKALEKAMKYRVSASENAQLAAQRKAMSLPPIGSHGSAKKKGDDWWKFADDDAIVEAANKDRPFR